MTRRPTIDDIAKLAGVSPGAVSYALNGRPGVSDLTRARIVEVAEEIGWRPNSAARALSVSRAHTVGWVIARPLDIEPFFTKFVTGLEAALAVNGTGLLLQVVGNHSAAIAAMRRWWAERRIDGVFLTDIWRDDPRLEVLESLGVPTVLVGRPQPGCSLPAVWSDEAPAVTGAVDYLVALGHRRIARVAGLERLDHTMVRTEAFVAAMRRHGLDYDRVLNTDYSPEQGARATRTLLTSPEPPTAITFDNDLMAVAALGVAQEVGLSVPDDLSLIAGDDSALCELVNPTMTGLARDIGAYGAQAARTLLEAIANGTAASSQEPTAHLVVRGSTGRISSPRSGSVGARSVAG